MKYEEALKMFYEDAKIGIHSLVEKEAIEYQYNKLKEVIAKAEKYDELTSTTDQQLKADIEHLKDTIENHNFDCEECRNDHIRLLGYMLKVEQYNQMLSEDDALKKLQSDYEQLQQFCGIQDKLWHDQVAHLAAEKDDLVSIIKDIQQITKLSISHDGTYIFWETPTEQTFIQDPLLVTKLQALLSSQEEKQ